MINDKMFKSLISINHKFMSINPTDLVRLLLESNYINGNSIKEKIKKYVESIDFVSSKFEKEREIDYASRKI